MSETRPASLMPLISSAETRKHEREQQHELLHTVKIASSEEEIKSGEGFYIAPRLMPEAYPGDKPETTGFLVDAKDGLVTGILWNSDSSLFVNQGDFNPVVERSDPESPDGKSQVPLDEYLTGKGLTPLSERYVLTAFGSNRCPGQLQHKFQKWIKDNEISDESIANDLLTVPAFNGILKGYDVVYNSTLGNLGYAFGDLYAGPETQDTEIEVVNLFLTKEQMQVIHESEVEYQFAEIGEVRLGSLIYDDKYGFGDFKTVPAYAHIGTAEAYAITDEQGVKRPVAIGDIYGRNRNLTSMDQSSFQDFHLGHDPTGKKTAALRLAKVLVDLEVDDKDYIQSLDVENLPQDLSDSLAKETLEPTGQNYRDWIRMGGKAKKLAIRRLFKEIAKQGTGEEERMIIDPSSASKTTIISRDPSDLPNWGEIGQSQTAA